jgi:hypothetical protein
MTNTVLIKRSSVANSIPLAGNLLPGELAINYNDGNLFYKNTSNVVTVIASNKFVSVSGNITGGNVITGGVVSTSGIVGTGNIDFVSSGNISLGNVGNIHISGGTSGYVLSTNGSGTLSWVAQSGGGSSTITVDDFTGDGSTTQFTLSVIPANINSTTVNYNGVIQLRTGYSLSGANIVFSTPPVSGSSIEVTSISVSLSGAAGANTQVQFNSGGGNLGASSAFTFNTASNVLSVVGNVAGTYFIGNGALLTGIAAGYGNTNVAVYLASGTDSSNIVTTANVTGGNVLTSGMVSATGNIIGSNIVGGNLSVGGNVLSNLLPVSNITYDLGSSTQRWRDLWLANSTIYLGNAQISANATALTITNPAGGTTVLQGSTPSITGNTVSASGNITGGNVLTSGLISATSTITSAANITGGNLLTGGLISATGNVTGGNVTTSVLNAVSGNLLVGTSAGNINIVPTTGNIVLSSGNTYINNVKYPVQNGDAASKDYVDTMISSGIAYHQAVYAATTTTLATTTGGSITYTQPNGAGNGIGAKLTTTGTFNLIDAANVQTVGTRILVKNEANAVYNGVYTWANATNIVRSTDTDEYGPNSVEQLSINDYFFIQSGNVNAGSAYVVDAPSGTITFGTSNITFAQFSTSQVYSANGSAGLSLSGTVFSVKVDNATTAFDGNGNIIVKASANLTTPNIGAATGTSLSVTANVTGGNLLTGGLISATSTITSAANITGGNVLTGGLISAAGNIRGNNISAVGDVNSNNLLTAGVVSATGNVTGGNVLTGGLISATSTITSAANITGGNVLTGGLISATGNITGGNILGGANVNATTHTGTTVSVTANITGGNILTVGLISATGNITSAANVSGTYFIGNGSQLTGITSTVSPAGSNTQIQFNDAGSLGASANLTFNKSTNTLNATNVTANGAPLATTGKAIAMAIVFGF